MSQTPKQRKANEKYAKNEAAKRGKGQVPVKQKQSAKSSLPTGWLAVLVFVICGGLAFELLGVIPKLWSATFGRFMD
ncbi:RAMP4 family protein [Aspergillus glaucus CBS 516.65]|uniref:Stress-associated endoplasmic reticulum protein n=1 Tax=Aspergillus glaucus CBS 516.65 TaxID=1160497 RepID=A0A1L9VB39_ASPGL|nr:hypothetical protein ASPGLDRAFT_772885 [Aspergillus glaucus CBS 516.65]OJJ81099.1 hypothetical protein ASPGLDRAFT_772885 [Aspergillus glaucus CBS 516.65]